MTVAAFRSVVSLSLGQILTITSDVMLGSAKVTPNWEVALLPCSCSAESLMLGSVSVNMISLIVQLVSNFGCAISVYSNTSFSCTGTGVISVYVVPRTIWFLWRTMPKLPSA